jgi:hypothetical protein
LGNPVKAGRIGSAPGITLDPLLSQGPRPPKRWPWVVLALLVLLAGGAVATWMRLTHSVETFALTLDLKMADGHRALRVTGTEVTIDEHPKKGKDVSTSCIIGMRDALGLQSLVRAKLVDGSPAGPVTGVFMTTVGAAGELSNGDVDAEAGAAVSDYVVKHASLCVQRP